MFATSRKGGYVCCERVCVDGGGCVFEGREIMGREVNIYSLTTLYGITHIATATKIFLKLVKIKITFNTCRPM